MCEADVPPTPTPRNSNLQKLNLQLPAFITIPIAHKTLGAITKTHVSKQHLQETPPKKQQLQLSLSNSHKISPRLVLLLPK